MLQRTLLPLFLLLLCQAPAFGQVSSSHCLMDLKDGLRWVDNATQSQLDSVLEVNYRVRFVEKSHPEDTIRENRKARFGSGLVHIRSKEQEVWLHEQDAWVYFPPRKIVYRLSPERAPTEVIEAFDPAVLDHGLVTACVFVPHTDTSSWKKISFEVEKSMHAKYGIRSLTAVWDPLDSVLVSLEMDHHPSARRRFSWYHFDGFQALSETMPPLNGTLLDGNGALSPEYIQKGVQLQDYR